jgi:hypothetical protein
MKTLLWPLIIILGIIIIPGCEYETIQAPIIEKPTPPDTNDTIKKVLSFKDTIEPMFSKSPQSCTACHPSTMGLDLTVGKAYASLKSKNLIDTPSANSVLWQKINGTHSMPIKTRFTAAELALLKEWLDKGAKNN